MESSREITLIESSVSRPDVELVHLFDKFKAVRALAFDVDGVFTDNSVLVTEAGELLRTMNVRDGYALKTAVSAGFPVCIITGGRSQGVSSRLSALGVEHIYSGIHDKWPVLQQFMQMHQLQAHELCYMGDDMLDLPILRRVGIATAPADAIQEVLDMADYISPLKGGQGCVRDVLEKVLKLQGKWPAL
jgi:3-deoxy-D-manno-octulosonate 8-phosphate phosphatase (KDO 8-P phosphatase)